MSQFSRREFLGKTAALAAAVPFMKLSPQSDTALKRGAQVEDLPFFSAADVAKAIRRGDISSLELTELMFKRIDSINPRINAVVTQMREEALARAKEADAARATWQEYFHAHDAFLLPTVVVPMLFPLLYGRGSLITS